MLLIAIYAIFVLSLVAQGLWNEEWLFGVMFVSGIIGFICSGLIPLIGHQEPVKTIALDSDSVHIAYDPTSDQTAFSFNDTDGNPIAFSIDDMNTFLKVSPEAKLVKSCPTPYKILTPWAWPDCQWTLYAPTK